MNTFSHLSLHTEYSVEDSIIRISDLADVAADRGITSIAITDKNNLFGLFKFYDACREGGIKPIIGVDLQVLDALGDSPDRLIALAATETGYANLRRLVSRSYRSNLAPRTVTTSMVHEMNEGLIVLSGGREGNVGKKLLMDDSDGAVAAARKWASVFGDRYYLELSRTGRGHEEQYIARAVELAANEQIPVVATNDVRFISSDQFEIHETRVCIQNKTRVNDENRAHDYSPDQYLRSADEMHALFADVPQAIENAQAITTRCNFETQVGTYFLPKYPVPKESSVDDLLKSRALEELERFLANRDADGSKYSDNDYRDRVNYELGIVVDMGFSDYFLLVEDMVRWAKDHDIPVGPGRGSGPASLVSYLLGITDLDPLEYELLFERLLNPDRVSMPDFDIDFCMNGRGQVIRYITEKYGTNAVGQIVTFGTMAAKAVVRDVTRVQGKPFAVGDQLARLIPPRLNITLQEAIDEVAELQMLSEDPEFGDVLDMSLALEGIVRNVGRHAAGVCIAPSELEEYIPYYTEVPNGDAISQFDKKDVEVAGLVKLDVLGLKTLTVLRWTCDSINEQRRRDGEDDLDLSAIPLDDAETYQLLQTSETKGVFQLESDGMRRIVKKLGPDRLDDIVALVALYRPGPLESGVVDDYIDRKHGTKLVEYPHELLRNVLHTTFGLMVYQEDVMNVCRALAGFSPGEADLMRSAMGKKNASLMAEMREKFMAGTAQKGVEQSIAEDVYRKMERFANYAFNRAHASGYAIVAYQTAYMKAHHPSDFLAASLSGEIGKPDAILELVHEVKRLQIPLNPPDVNHSEYLFTAENGSIRYGLGGIKGIGNEHVNAISTARNDGPFRSLYDLCRRVDAKQIGSSTLRTLIECGAMDGLDSESECKSTTRSRLLATIDESLKRAEQARTQEETGVDDFFGGVDEEDTSIGEVDAAPLLLRERLDAEARTIGFCMSGHQVEPFRSEAEQVGALPLTQVPTGDKKEHTVVGFVVDKRLVRRNDGTRFGLVELEDGSGHMTVTLSERVYEDEWDTIATGTIVTARGTTSEDSFSNGTSMRAKSVSSLETLRRKRRAAIEVSMSSQQASLEFFQQLVPKLTPFRGGRCKVRFVYDVNDVKTVLELKQFPQLQPQTEAIEVLQREFGEESVRWVYPS